ncbi:HEPN domain-containing protein [Chryseobacterium mucoviscidosis]|uniref:HEPN domain-containing protein n=1 Tax=Chryseobacterium mucoviscidosis TaxID=1945581 RepID=UPI003015B6C7
MAKSKRIIQLISRLNFLEKNILPNQRLDGNYTKKEQDLIRSFVLLSHAEIESYLEDIAKEKISKSLNDWNNNRKKSHCIKSVVSFVGNEISFENDSNSKNLQYRVNKIVSHYLRAVIDRNHGVKEKNILDLLLPIGIEWADLDTAWLATMDSFGTIRGAIAHSSFKVQSTIDRNTELDRIKNQILPELLMLDAKIKAKS